MNKPPFLKDILRVAAGSPDGRQLLAAEEAGAPVPQILYLFGYKPELTKHLASFTQELMRGPSDLHPGMRELIAAYTSRGNDCLF